MKLHKDGHRVVIVSSGAIGVGLRRMDVEKRPKHLPRMQVFHSIDMKMPFMHVDFQRRLWQRLDNVGS